MLEVGIRGASSVVVEEQNTARVVGSGNVQLLSTAIMVAHMEKAAWTSVQPYLEEGQGTVGIHMDVKHTKPTPIGYTAKAESELVEIKGKRLIFRVTAFDDAGPIGEGMHTRFIVQEKEFEAAAAGN